jgi:hypothetical protein
MPDNWQGKRKPFCTLPHYLTTGSGFATDKLNFVSAVWVVVVIGWSWSRAVSSNGLSVLPKEVDSQFAYLQGILLCHRAWQLYRLESLHPSGHTVSAVVLRANIKGTPCMWQHIDMKWLPPTERLYVVSCQHLHVSPCKVFICLCVNIMTAGTWKRWKHCRVLWEDSSSVRNLADSVLERKQHIKILSINKC